MIESILCKKCLRPIRFDANGEPLAKDGVCYSCCLEEKQQKAVDWTKKKGIFEEKIKNIKRTGEFDGLIMLSGGKDSVYIAYMLSKVYKLRLLAVTIDNGFEYDSTFKVAGEMAQKLSISHMCYRLPFEEMKEYYKFLLTEKEIKVEDGSQMCFFCGRLLKEIAVRIAKAMNIPVVFSGHTDEQIQALGEENGDTKQNDVRRRMVQNYAKNAYKTALEQLERNNKESLKHLFANNIEANQNFTFIYPLEYFEYKPLEITALLEKELGWKPDTHFNKKYISSGCRIAKLMEYMAIKNKTVTYVQREFSAQIRRGVMQKDEVMDIIESRVEDENKEVEELLGILGISEEQL